MKIEDLEKHNKIKYYVVGKLRRLAIEDPTCEFEIEEFVDEYTDLGKAVRNAEQIVPFLRHKGQEIIILKIFSEYGCVWDGLKDHKKHKNIHQYDVMENEKK